MKHVMVAILLLSLSVPAARALTNDALMDSLQATSFKYFWLEANPSNGLIRDRSQSGSPGSIAAVGFGLSAICTGIDHGWITRDAGRTRVLTTLQTFWNGPQGSGTSGIIGYKGLFYHFLDMTTATRTWDCELSTIDTALLFAGILDSKQYFTLDEPHEAQIRALADSLYYRADWNFMRNGLSGIEMGWRPDTGFSTFGQWVGYNEAMILYILALGSPTHPVPSSAWLTWTSGYWWSTQYGQTYVIFPPLFGHQYSHCWIDFRAIADAYMRTKGINYFENSRRATVAQRAYCIANPHGWIGYGANFWGLTACDGPDGYAAHGAPPPQSDDGTIAPTAAAGSIPFAPEYALPTLQNFYNTYHTDLWSVYGFRDGFNLSRGWFDPDYLGIDEGPIILAIENYRTQAVWNRFMANADIQRGLASAGFLPDLSSEGGQPIAPSAAVLDQNRPNPFTGSTVISFRLAAPARIVLTLFDAGGRRVRVLAGGERPAGPQTLTLKADRLRSGIYFYSLSIGNRTLQKRCVLIR